MDLGIPNIYATAGIQATTTAALPSGTGNPSETEDTKAMQEQLDKARNERNTRAIAVGLGVGIPLGLLLIAAIAGGWWWMKRTRRLMEARAAQLKAEEKYRVMQSELGGSGRIEVPGQSPWAEVDGRAAWEVDGKDRWAEMGAKEGVIRRVEMP
jgi:hypothetical protein